MAKKNYGMVIDLHRCVGCAACDIACKSENNVPDGFNWSNHVIETMGKFPDVRYRYIPTLCNHCENAPCVLNCPTTAMHKSPDGLTLHDADLCIGCRACQVSCPYGAVYFNEDTPHRQYSHDDSAAIAGCTSTGSEVTQNTGVPLPYYNPERAETYHGVRAKGVEPRASSRSAPCVITVSRKVSCRGVWKVVLPVLASSAT
jgi:molybdopterin-containing oxidoreductase family iron-sulfur binding subunit